MILYEQDQDVNNACVMLEIFSILPETKSTINQPLLLL